MPAVCNCANAAPASTEPSCFTSPTRITRASCLSARSNRRAVSRADNNDASSTIHATGWPDRSEEHTSELQSLMRISYAVFCLKKKNKHTQSHTITITHTQQHDQ